MPALQDLIEHTPAVHCASPPEMPQVVPQAPQLSMSVFRSVSQPLWSGSSSGSPLQSPRPAAQTVSPHWPLRHQAVLPALALQALPQPPQLLMSRLTSFSQPLPGFSSQSAKFSAQVRPHWPSEQYATPLRVGHGLAAHAPQLSTSFFVFTSQPSAGSPLQSSNGAMQLSTRQIPPAQFETALGSEQAVLQSPQ